MISKQQIKSRTNRIRKISTVKISLPTSTANTREIDEKFEQISLESYQNKTDCEFNPCQNNGACLLLDQQRFICLCKKFFYGDFCEINGVDKSCHKNHMEIYIDKSIAKSLNIKIDLLYVNKKEVSNECKIINLNETHFTFRIPYDKCSTKFRVTFLKKHFFKYFN